MQEPTPKHWDIVIVGGGAAGLASAIFAAERALKLGTSPRIAVVDGARKLGAKILVSGGGRCNVTHEQLTDADYFGSTNIIRRILRSFDHRQAARWFEDLGVPLKTEPTGKLFPRSNSARSVLGALLDRCDQLGVHLLTQHRIGCITATPKGPFLLQTAGSPLQASTVVLATGGKSLPKSGSDGKGLLLAKALGHSVVKPLPALVPLVLKESFFHPALSGIAHPAELSVCIQNKQVEKRSGDMLWTHFGLSGPLAMDISRTWVRHHDAGREPGLTLNLLQDSFECVEGWLVEANQSQPNRSLGRLLAERLPKGAVAGLLEHLQICPEVTMGSLRKKDRKTLVHGLTRLPLPVHGHRGWNHAEVTSGGVPLEECAPKTLESRHTPNLFLVGEILDCDGRIGGFNFQWAWSTGYLAGRAAAQSLTS